MKKRILFLIPCILLALGLLTACGSNGGQTSDEAAEQQLINTKWNGNTKQSSGLIDIDLPFSDHDLVTIEFKSDSNGKTGYISVLGEKVDFTWTVTNGKVVLTFKNFIHIPLNYEFGLDKNSLSLTGTGIDIKLNR